MTLSHDSFKYSLVVSYRFPADTLNMKNFDQQPLLPHVAHARTVSMREAFGPGYQAAVVYDTHFGVANAAQNRR